MWEGTGAYSRIRALVHTHGRRSSYLPSLRALLSNMPGMLLPNMPSAKWSVKIPAGLSDFTRAGKAFSFFRTRRDRSGENGGWIGARWYHTSPECRAIDIKTFPNHSNVRECCGNRTVLLFRAGEDHQSRTRKLMNAPRNFMNDTLHASRSNNKLARGLDLLANCAILRMAVKKLTSYFTDQWYFTVERIKKNVK